jgi:predicted GNAT superfamily acetyltransferase
VVEVRLAQTSEEIDRAIDLAETVWGARPMAEPVLRALELAGSYVSVALDGGEMVGMCAGFVGVHDDGLHLHSHLAAVVPRARGRGTGRALKRHQRDWCLDHDIETVTWTFDPLVRENARFNLHHLGATGDRYLVDLYGEMDDDINRGQPSDRLLVRWDLLGAETVLALDTPLPVTTDEQWRREGAGVAVRSVDGWPSVTDTAAELRLVATPPAVVELRRARPEAALEWRLAVRRAMTAAIDDGLRPVAVTEEGSYLLCRRHQPAPAAGSAR